MANHRGNNRGQASVKEILGAAEEQKDIPQKWQKYYRQLSHLREHLLKKQGDFAGQAREEQPNFSQHMADAATDESDMDTALAFVSAEQDSLYEVEQAMSRILDGTYGVCELTGKPIPRERLDAVPWTRFSQSAEAELEKRGQARRTSLGERDRIVRDDTLNSVGQRGLNTRED